MAEAISIGWSEEILEEYNPLDKAHSMVKGVAFKEITAVGYPPHLAHEIVAKMDNLLYPVALSLSMVYWKATGACTDECAYLPHFGGFWGDCCRDHAAGEMKLQAEIGAFGLVRKLTRLMLAAIEPALYCCQGTECCYLESKAGWYVPTDAQGLQVVACRPCAEVRLSLGAVMADYERTINAGGSNAFAKSTGGGALVPLALLGGAALLATQG